MRRESEDREERERETEREDREERERKTEREDREEREGNPYILHHRVRGKMFSKCRSLLNEKVWSL